MPGTCPYTKINGEPCDRPVGSFELCGHHRERAASKPSRPCSSCGKPTKREGGLCIGRVCGWNAYRRELAQRKKAATAAAAHHSAEGLAAQDAAEENQRRAEENQRRAEEAAEEVADAMAGLAPWPEWMGVTREEFEAAGDRADERHEANEAAQRAQQEAAAALVEALRAAEAEAAAAAD